MILIGLVIGFAVLAAVVAAWVDYRQSRDAWRRSSRRAREVVERRRSGDF